MFYLLYSFSSQYYTIIEDLTYICNRLFIEGKVVFIELDKSKSTYIKMKMNNKITVKNNISYLILYSSFIDSIGLLNGKMGIIIFFYHYAVFTGCKRYHRFADELIKELYLEISIQSPVGFANGLCGIAWGITYLIINKFVEADNDVLDEIDGKIMEIAIERIKDYSLEHGLAGIGYYAMSRYCFQSSNGKCSKEFIKKLLSALLKSNDNNCMRIYNNYQAGKYENSEQLGTDLLYFLTRVKRTRNIIPSTPLSLNGVAGYSLKQILRRKGNGHI